MEFKLPDLGEGVHEGEIVKWLVKEGDQVKEDQPMVEVMTDKATVEIPAPTAGKVKKINFKAGDMVEVGQVLVEFESQGAKPSAPKESPKVAPKAEVKASPERKETGEILATPAVRKLAKDLGVDLSKVKGSGDGGRILESDLQKSKDPSSASKEAPSGTERFRPIPIARKEGQERIVLKGVRKTIAHHLQLSKYYAPHFTYVEEVDLTSLVQFREKKNQEAEQKGLKLTYLAFVVKALIPALKEFPYLNASLDETTQEIVLKKYYNIGIAVDSQEGLMVPVIKNVDQKDVFQIAKEIIQLAQAVRENKARPEDLKDSTFTVTSIGNIGGVFATPILNYPDVAILGLNRIVERPVVVGGKIVPRHMVYLSLSLDHRVVDGAMGARFMNKLIEVLQQPASIS